MKLPWAADRRSSQKKIAIGLFAVLALGVMWYEVKDPTSAPTNCAGGGGEPSASGPAAAAGGMRSRIPLSVARSDAAHGAMLVSESLEYSGSAEYFSASRRRRCDPTTDQQGAGGCSSTATDTVPPNCPPPLLPSDRSEVLRGEDCTDGKREGVPAAGEKCTGHRRATCAGAIGSSRWTEDHPGEDMQNHNSQTLPLLAN